MKIFTRILLLVFFFNFISFSFGQDHKKPLSERKLKKRKEYTSLKQALKNYKRVYKLNLNNQSLKSLPADIKKLSNLQILNLEGNNLIALPKEIYLRIVFPKFQIY
ncbi:MAG: hypothetical protein B6I24_03990 [Bacteroidetes bacterium 4572_128]|nr:MAG: hypothetical protein B6I24_03990 [Bacteroidetes bacterium 4572_128]